MNNSLTNKTDNLCTDRQLLKSIAELADKKVFVIFYNRYGQNLLRYLRASLDNRDAVPDISQDLWLYVWQHAAQLKVSGYYRIAARDY